MTPELSPCAMRQFAKRYLLMDDLENLGGWYRDSIEWVAAVTALLVHKDRSLTLTGLSFRLEMLFASPFKTMPALIAEMAAFETTETGCTVFVRGSAARMAAAATVERDIIAHFIATHAGAACTARPPFPSPFSFPCATENKPMTENGNDNRPAPEHPVNDNRPEITEEDYLRAAATATARAAETGPVSVDPDVADFMGAFEEDALSPQDALDSLIDGMADDMIEANEMAANEGETGHD
ncbi:MAG: hypothetical protein VR70_16730 [Rhodospirillaceae bacterium BRH_c57]|nr:MAG: hypothetical protein VR70_16730 [Rhodospirillaceae bacterium BRH_c57]